MKYRRSDDGARFFAHKTKNQAARTRPQGPGPWRLIRNGEWMKQPKDSRGEEEAHPEFDILEPERLAKAVIEP